MMNKEVAEYSTEEKILLYLKNAHKQARILPAIVNAAINGTYEDTLAKLEQLVKEGILIKNYDAYCPETEDYIRTVSFNIEASGKNKCKVVLQKIDEEPNK